MNVFWTRGYRREGADVQLGLVVVRPGRVAFLPLGIPMGAGEQLAFGASRTRHPGAVLRMDVPWQGRYPIEAWWRHGEHALDAEVHRALQQPGAAMLTNAEAGLVRRKHTPAVFVPFAPDAAMITLDQAPPPVLLAMWRPGVLPFAKTKAIVVTSTVTFFIVGLTTMIELVLYSPVDGFNPVPLVFFGIIVAILWAALIVRMREHARDLAAQAQSAPAIGPYR